MIKLIASDVDGTILQRGETKVRQEIFDAINAAYEKGILFVIASGRPYCELKHLFEPVMDKIALVCSDGALTVYHGKNISKIDMDREMAEKLLEDVDKKEDCEFLVYGEFIAYMKPKDEEYDKKIRQTVYNNVNVIDKYKSIVGDDFLKIGIYNKNGITKVEDYFLSKWGKVFNVIYSANEWLEFTAPGVNKSVGIKALCEYFKITKDEMAAFGDSYNDYEMFRCVGKSYAMATAKEGLKEIATGISERVDITVNQLLKEN